jgi:hypothetical protein
MIYVWNHKEFRSIVVSKFWKRGSRVSPQGSSTVGSSVPASRVVATKS